MMLPRPRVGRISVVTLLELALLVAAFVVYLKMTRTAEQLTQEIGSLRAENFRLKQEAVRVAERQREADLERERAGAQSAQKDEPRANESAVEADPNGLLERVIRLKSYFAQHPERGIPEMRLLTDEEWMQQAKDADLDTEEGNRKALHMLRQIAQVKMGISVETAMKSYMAANPGQTPTDAMQLAPYLQRPEYADLLPRFQTYDEPDTTHGYLFKASAAVDPWFNFKVTVGPNGVGLTVNAPAYTVEGAAADFLKATGTSPTDVSQLIPYLKTPVSTALLEDIFNGLKKSKN